jgi:DNA-directed RNA polymerase subunit F
VHLSKKAKKLLKSLQKEPSIKWINEITSVVPSQPKEIKVFYKKNEGSKKKKSKKSSKQTDIQKYVDALEEYNPDNPIPAILQDYIPKKV